MRMPLIWSCSLFFCFLQANTATLHLSGWKADYNSGDIPWLISEDTAVTKMLMLI